MGAAQKDRLTQGRRRLNQTQPLACDFEPAADHLGIFPFAAHPLPPTRDHNPCPPCISRSLRHDLGRPPRIMCRQPFLPQFRDLSRQAEHDPAGRICPGFSPRRQKRLKLMIGQTRHQRGRHHPHRNARLGQPMDRRQTPLRARRARLHLAGQFRVERRHRHPNPQQPPVRHRRQKINVTFNQCAFGHNRNRMVEVPQNCQTVPHQPIVTFAGVDKGPYWCQLPRSPPYRISTTAPCAGSLRR